MLEYEYLARPVKLAPLTLERLPEMSDRGATYLCHIRKGIFFTPDPAFKGKPRELIADDYVYSYKRWMDPNGRRGGQPILTDLIIGARPVVDAARTAGKFDYSVPIEGLRAGLTVMTVEQFLEMIGAYLQGHDYHEQELARRVERFGHVAHVWSTYESTYQLHEGRELSYARGINSLQLFWDGDRWWIASMLWDTEDQAMPLPAAYLEGTSIAALSTDHRIG